MKQKTMIFAGIGVLFLLAGVSAFALTNDAEKYGATNYFQRGYRMMGNLDENQIKQMDEVHDEFVKTLDPKTAEWMNSMHENCIKAYSDNT